MKPENIGPILAMAEQRERREWRRKQEAALRADNERNLPSARAIRARHFAYQIMGMLSKHIPEACHDEALTELMVNAYGHDVEIALVPPERDAKIAAELELAKTTLTPNIIIKD